MTDLYQAHILTAQRYSYQDIDLTITSETSRIKIEEIQIDLQNAWNKKVAELAELNLPVWDGTTYRVEDIDFNDNRISLSLSPTIKYRELFTESLFTDYYRSNPLYYFKHLSIAAIVETSDGKFIMGETTYPHRAQYDTIGGGVQESELPINTSLDLQRTLHKEVKEEIGVLPHHISEEYICGIVVGSKTNMIIISRLRLNVTSDDLQALFLTRTDKDEFKDIATFSKDEYKKLCNASASYRPFLSQLVEV